MNTIPSCMDRYMNRYMVQPSPHPPPPPNGFYHQQQAAACGTPNTAPHNSYVIGCFQNGSANGWTGVPLISTAARRPRKLNNNVHNSSTNSNNSNNSANISNLINLNRGRADFDENAISRLAIHAHGAPLILTGRYRSSKPNKSRDQQPKSTYIYMKDDTQNLLHNHHHHLHHQDLSTAASTTASLTQSSTIITNNGSSSLCSSSSNGNVQETCLPRIIKPRKRRKKDRKPNVTQLDIKSSSAQDDKHVAASSTTMASASSLGLTTTMMMGAAAAAAAQQEVQQDKDILLDTELISSCSCRLCDPYCRIWAFPLRRSCSDNSAENTDVGRAPKNVGVIGSNRLSTVRNEWRSSPQLIDIALDYCTGSRKGSFSDSGDSGCDLLSGLNFSDELLTRPNFRPGSTDSSSTISSSGASSTSSSNNSVVKFPSDSEYILNKNINDISRKMLESLDLKGDGEMSSDESVFSDSGTSDLTNILFNYNDDSSTTAPRGLIYNYNNFSSNLKNYNNNNINNNNNLNDSMTLIQENDKGSEIFNCLDMVLSRSKILSSSNE